METIITYVTLSRRPLPVQRQQPREDLLVAEIRWPAIARGDGRIERAVRASEPRGPGVVQRGERPGLPRRGVSVGRVKPSIP